MFSRKNRMFFECEVYSEALVVAEKKCFVLHTHNGFEECIDMQYFFLYYFGLMKQNNCQNKEIEISFIYSPPNLK